MRVDLISVFWHNLEGEKHNEPILSCSFDPSSSSSSRESGGKRLATAGGDKTIKIWDVLENKEEEEEEAREQKKRDGASDEAKVGEEQKQSHVEYKETITRHAAVVNCVKFSPDGAMLASCGDRGEAFVFEKREEQMKGEAKNDSEADVHLLGSGSKNDSELKEGEEDAPSLFKCKCALRGGTADALDLTWSADSQLVAVSYIDWRTIIYDVANGGIPLIAFEGKKGKGALGASSGNGHTSFVQGVAFDALSKWIVSVSADRTMCAWSTKKVTLKAKKGDKLSATKKVWATSSFKYSSCAKSAKNSVDSGNLGNESNDACSSMLFHDDTLPSFFRRPCFSPCGSFLVVPSGILKEKVTENGDAKKTETIDCAHVFSRDDLTQPKASLPSLKPSTCVAFLPKVFKLKDVKNEDETIASTNPFRGLKHRCIFCVCTIDGAMVYDTEVASPVAVISNAHYAAVTCATWSADGRTLVLSSKDGFCSFVRFEEGEFGEEIEMPKLAPETEEAEEENKENETIIPAGRNPDQATVDILFANNKSKVEDTNKGAAPTGRRITPVAMM
jgi:chromatin assembly factor 1 subunit B